MKYKGRPCLRGHSGTRYRSTNACVECASSVWRKPPDDKERQRKARWKRDNLIASNAIHHRRRSRLRGAKVEHVTGKQLHALLLRQGKGCAYCGDKQRLELDHKTPLAKGGAHALYNLQWLCAFHNRDKGARTDSHYRKRWGIPSRTPWDAASARI